MIHATIIDAGLKGTATLIRGGGSGVLVDAGASAEVIESAIRTSGIDPRTLSGILLTHEHRAQTRALRPLSEKFRIPVFTNAATAEVLRPTCPKAQWCIFLNDTPFRIGSLTVHPFPVSHDAIDPVGFVISEGATSFAIATDIGHVSSDMVTTLQAVDGLLLEANHDTAMLQADPLRTGSVKKRVLSEKGHLSNEQAADLVASLASLRHVVLAHLSDDCNSPTLATDTITRRTLSAGGKCPTIHCPQAAGQFPYIISI